MNFILLTQEDGMIMGPVSKVLGWIMEGIFTVLDLIMDVPNIGLVIILFTIVVNLLMMPLTIKQQKFSKLSAKIQPEMQAIQAKYKNKKDEASMMAQNQEIQELYAKYGVSPTGGCGYLLIQMPIILALYRVIYKIPAYVTKIGDTFRVLANKIIKSEDSVKYLTNSVEYVKDPKNFTDLENIGNMFTDVSSATMYSGQFKSEAFQKGIEEIEQLINNGTLEQTLSNQNDLSQNIVTVQNTIIDVLNKASSSELNALADANKFDLFTLQHNGKDILGKLVENGEGLIEQGEGLIDQYNTFLGMNMGNTPAYMMDEANGSVLLMAAALAIPVLAAVTQWINAKLIPQQNNQSNNGNSQADTMASSMKAMNTVMPIMSAVFCYTMPTGIGLYWIAGSVVRSIQQIIVNKHMDNINIDDIIKKNSKKSAKKMEKLKKNQERMAAYSNMKTKNIESKANPYNYQSKSSNSQTSDNNTSYVSNAKPGSMMAKANMVKDFNEKNNK